MFHTPPQMNVPQQQDPLFEIAAQDQVGQDNRRQQSNNTFVLDNNSVVNPVNARDVRSRQHSDVRSRRTNSSRSSAAIRQLELQAQLDREEVEI